MNSRQKGARGEREWAAWLCDAGCPARRGQQFHGGPDSPDVVCEALARHHFEVKRTETFNAYNAMEQATAEAPKGGIPTVVHKRNRGGWLVVLRAEDFLALALLAKAAEALAKERPT